jgi:hypothetical protein
VQRSNPYHELLGGEAWGGGSAGAVVGYRICTTGVHFDLWPLCAHSWVRGERTYYRLKKEEETKRESVGLHWLVLVDVYSVWTCSWACAV